MIDTHRLEDVDFDRLHRHTAFLVNSVESAMYPDQCFKYVKRILKLHPQHLSDGDERDQQRQYLN